MAKVAISQVRGGPEGLTSLDEIVEAALALVAREGLEALTMRRLADELGRAVMTLYTYVATKNDLLEKMAERTLGSLGDPPPKGDWRRRVTGLMTELHDRLLARPAVASITLGRERQLTAAPLLTWRPCATDVAGSGRGDVDAGRPATIGDGSRRVGRPIRRVWSPSEK